MKALKNWGLNKIRTRDKLRYTGAELLSLSDQANLELLDTPRAHEKD